MVAIPVDLEKVSAEVNPKKEPAYNGPTGTLKGTIRIEGDAPPDIPVKLTKGCGEAAATYGKLFRVGVGGALADAMVAVTGYQGFVPAKEEALTFTIHGCALETKTIVATYGQRIDVTNKDTLESYMPYLNGAESRAVMVAVPGGVPVKLYPHAVGHYQLGDQLPSNLFAEVFVLKYATHAVSGLDGRYEIKGIPVGKVHVDAYLPSINRSVGQVFEVKEGDNTVDLTLKYDLKAEAAAKAAASADAGAAPAPSGSGSGSAKGPALPKGPG